MKVVYIVGKYTDKNEKNILYNCTKASLEGIEIAKEGYAVITPHTNFLGHSKYISYEQIMNQCYTLIRKADIIYVLDNWKTSKGSYKEILLARKLKKKIIYQGD